MNKKMKKIFLTGERPTGNLHIGHFFGTIKKRIKIQKKHKNFIIIADNQLNINEKKNKEKNINKLITSYISMGISTKKSCIFIQSKIKELLTLEYFLSNFIDINTIKRNPTIKKNIENKKNISCNDFLYPVSQAADILLFNANSITVGIDQVPILEITNKIVRNVNNFYNKKIFRKCKAILSKNNKIIGTDGVKKMSKSIGNTISFNYTKKKLKKIIFKLKTDNNRKNVFSPGNYKNSLVFNYLKLFQKKKEYNLIKKMYKEGLVSDIKTKKILFKKIWRINKRVRNKRKKINNKFIKYIIHKGNKKAREIAKKRIKFIKKKTAFF
ncbi:tryptophan--tRNA ligase [Candidatus Vidania fulgoroideorum]